MAKKREENRDWFWRQLNEYLDKQNLKQSKQRNTIIDYLFEMNDHVAAEDLHAYIRDRNHNTGLATIYRTLNLLKEAGLVEQKQFADGKAIFEIVEPDSHHDHLICLDCDRVIEFENDAIEKLQEEVAKKNGLQLSHHRLDLFGHCTVKNCRFRKRK